MQKRAGAVPLTDIADGPRLPAGDRPSLLGMRPEELLAWATENGVPCGIQEARKVLGHVISEGNDDLYAMRRPVGKALVRAIDAGTRRDRLVVL